MLSKLNKNKLPTSATTSKTTAASTSSSAGERGSATANIPASARGAPGAEDSPSVVADEEQPIAPAQGRLYGVCRV